MDNLLLYIMEVMVRLIMVLAWIVAGLVALTLASFVGMVLMAWKCWRGLEWRK